MTITKVSGVVAVVSAIGAAVVTIIGTAYAVDNLYQRKAAADEAEKRQNEQLSTVVARLIEKQDRDRATAALRTAETELAFLTAKQKPTADDANKIDFLRDEIKRLRAELQK